MDRDDEPTHPHAPTVIVASPPSPEGLKPGALTSEYRIIRRTAAVGDAMVALGILYEVLSEVGAVLPESKAVTVAVIVVGAAVRVAAALGYSHGRVSLKRGRSGR